MCGSRIPGAYVAYELALAAVFAAAYLKFGLTLALIAFLLALTLLAFITIYDLRHTIVPPAASLLFVVCAVAHAYLVTYPFSGLLLLTGVYALCIGLFFLLVYALSRGRAMGLGDAPVALGLALLAGNAALAGFFFSFWVGGVIGILILVFRRGGPTMGIEVPFVPFMAIGFLLALFTQWNPLPF
jgi:prepilin signal peptidase PulO-like enzyme (type II secretory pathway)